MRHGHFVVRQVSPLITRILGKDLERVIVGWIGVFLGVAILIGMLICVLAKLNGPRNRFSMATVWTLLTFVGVGALALLFLVVGISMLDRKERAVAAIQERNGLITRDEASPDQPVIKVSFRNYFRLNDKDIGGLKPHLEALTELRELDLYGVNISDKGLLELRGLTQLKTLILKGAEKKGAAKNALPDGTKKDPALHDFRDRMMNRQIELPRHVGIETAVLSEKGVEEIHRALPDTTVVLE